MSYTDNPSIFGSFVSEGVQVAGGVPFKINEQIDAKVCCWRIGLFGLDKLKNVDNTVEIFKNALDQVGKKGKI